MRLRGLLRTSLSLAALIVPARAMAAPLIIDGSVSSNTCAGGTVRDGGRACEYGGTKTFDYVELKNNAVLYVTKFNGTDKANTGNLVLKATGRDPTNTFSIKVDKTSRISAKGTGYPAINCDNGSGPDSAPLSGGRGGCAVLDSGGGGGHFGPGGRGTKDNPTSFPAGYEEACGTRTSASTCSTQTAGCRNNDGLPSVAGTSFSHSIYQPEFGAAGGDKGCGDNSGDFADGVRGGNGGGRVVLFAANGAQTGALVIDGRVMADGNRGCAAGNDSAGGGAGGTILLIGDNVKVGPTARLSSHGGRGGDSQIKCLPCTSNADCGSGQTCNQIVDPQSGVSSGVCNPCNCTPCTTDAQCNAALGQTCKTLSGLGKMCADSSNRCTPFDPGDNEVECKGTQNSGTCDDCGGGGGGGLINVMSRVSKIDPLAVFDVRGAYGGVCPICTGEAGGGVGELQLDSAYVGEICDGWDNDFDGDIDNNLPMLQCADGLSIPSCVDGVPQTCPVNPAQCNVPAKDARPRFTLIVDTSGSMLNDVSGNPLFGDGSSDHPGVNTGNPSRLYTAKSAVSKVIAAFPENGYALGRYYQDVGTDRSCQTASNFECANLCCSYDNPSNNVTPVYPTTYPDNQCVLNKLYPGANYPVPSAFSSNISIGWPQPGNDACINYAGSCGPPRRGAQIVSGFDQPLSRYLMWLDHKESNFKETATDAEGFRCLNGDCEFRGTGGTPLAGALLATADYLKPIIACDGAKTCRQYATILLTDGAESCQGNPATAAAELKAAGVKTYVIGFSVLPSEKAQLNAIATAGGTNAAQFTGGTDAAFFAASESALADALASIISSSQVFEKCNGVDDNCNGLIDEGFPDKGAACDNGKLGACKVTGAFVCSASGEGTVCSVAGNPGPAPGVEVCNGIDDDCDGQIDEGLNCSTCIPQLEVCNGKDDNCDGQIDEPQNLVDVGKPCGIQLGACTAGITACVGGVLECAGAVGAQPEVCNGLDDDCDGQVDGMTRACYDGPAGTEDVGACHAGTQKCNAVAGGAESYSACVGQIVPSKEVCDGIDNDCNGIIDDLIEDEAGHKTGEPCCPFGEQCGVGECTAGVYQCVGNVVACAGGVGPSPERCDEKDNDCNGLVDDLPGLGTACAQPGGCAGIRQCDTTSQSVVCASPDVPNLEVCNGLDDNCNGQIDEEPAVSENDPKLGKPCDVPEAPNDKGLCKAGVTVCSNGGVSCDGSIRAESEICDGVDNDCDGETDEGAQCPGNTKCMMGQCAAPCAGGEFPCPGGYECTQGFCISVSCDGVTCPDGQTCVLGQCVVDTSAGGSAGSGQGGDAGAAGEGAGGSSGQAGASGAAGSGASGASGAGGATAGTGGSGGVSAGSGGTSDEAQNSKDVFGLSTGGGGLNCGVSSGRPSSPTAALAGLIGLLGLALRRRVARKSASREQGVA